MPGRLRAFSTGAKILYTAFAIATMVGLVVSWRLYGAAVEGGGPAVYYAGAEAPAAAPTAAPEGDGPSLDLPDEEAKPRSMTAQMPERKLLEVTHFHLFSIPVYVLILAHLFLLAKIPVWLQNAGTVAAVITSALHIAAPWIVRGSASIAWLMPISGILMLLVLGAMTLVATIDMWLPQPPMPSPAARMAELRKMRERENT